MHRPMVGEAGTLREIPSLSDGATAVRNSAISRFAHAPLSGPKTSSSGLKLSSPSLRWPKHAPETPCWKDRSSRRCMYESQASCHGFESPQKIHSWRRTRSVLPLKKSRCLLHTHRSLILQGTPSQHGRYFQQVVLELFEHWICKLSPADHDEKESHRKSQPPARLGTTAEFRSASALVSRHAPAVRPVWRASAWASHGGFEKRDSRLR